MSPQRAPGGGLDGHELPDVDLRGGSGFARDDERTVHLAVAATHRDSEAAFP